MQIYALNAPKYVWRLGYDLTCWGAYPFPQTSSRNGGILLRAGRKGEGAYFKGRRMGVEGGEREKKGRGRESPPKVKMSRINSGQCRIQR